MFCPQCGEVVVPGPLDASKIAVSPGSALRRLLRLLFRQNR